MIAKEEANDCYRRAEGHLLDLHTASTGFVGRTPQALTATKDASAERFPGDSFSPALVVPAKLPLTGLPWRATQSGPDHASAPMTQRPWYLLPTGLAAREHDGDRVVRQPPCGMYVQVTDG